MRLKIHCTPHFAIALILIGLVHLNGCVYDPWISRSSGA